MHRFTSSRVEIATGILLLGHEILLCTFPPLAPALPSQNTAFRWFQKLARSTFYQGPKPFHVSKPVRSSFHQGPKPLRAALPPCQRFARSNAPALRGRNTVFIKGFKICAKHVLAGPQTPPCSFSPLPALCQVECPCFTRSKYCIYKRF